MPDPALPSAYWHVQIKLAGHAEAAVRNDMTLRDITRDVLQPWRSGSQFSFSGLVVRTEADVAGIKIVHTADQTHYFEQQRRALKQANPAIDLAVPTSLWVFDHGTDHTNALLFSQARKANLADDMALVLRLCQRLPQAARILAARSRKDKAGYQIVDEYDVQDLLHAMLRGYLKYSVQEDSLPKVAAAFSSRADITIESLGMLIEIKYVRGPQDQRRLLDEYSQDLVLYAQWPHLTTLIYLIYHSADLRDAEAFEKLSGPQHVNGRSFEVKVLTV